jgi:hypothetical protein
MQTSERENAQALFRWTPNELFVFEPGLRSLVVANGLLNFLRLAEIDARRHLAAGRRRVPIQRPHSLLPRFRIVEDLSRVALPRRSGPIFDTLERLVWTAAACAACRREPLKTRERTARACALFSPEGGDICGIAHTLARRARDPGAFTRAAWFFVNGDGSIVFDRREDALASAAGEAAQVADADSLASVFAAGVDPDDLGRALRLFQALRDGGVRDVFELLRAAAYNVARSEDAALPLIGRVMAVEALGMTEAGRTAIEDRVRLGSVSRDAIEIAARFPVRIMVPPDGRTFRVVFDESSFIAAVRSRMH